MAFPTTEKFNDSKITQEPILKWREIPMDVILKVDKVETLKTKFGETLVLTVSTKEGASYKAWATQRLTEDLRDYSWCSQTAYLRSLGKKPCIKNPTHSYYDYDIMFSK